MIFTLGGESVGDSRRTEAIFHFHCCARSRCVVDIQQVPPAWNNGMTQTSGRDLHPHPSVIAFACCGIKARSFSSAAKCNLRFLFWDSSPQYSSASPLPNFPSAATHFGGQREADWKIYPQQLKWLLLLYCLRTKGARWNGCVVPRNSWESFCGLISQILLRA